MSTTVSIGEAAASTGISAETLRMWERRYGRPRPIRLPSGHRRFTPGQVRWLRRVAEALSHGFRPGQVVRLDDESLGKLLAGAEHGEEADHETERLLELLEVGRSKEVLDAVRRRWEAAHPLRFLSGLVAPLVVAVGRCWADGDLAIRNEHLFSSALDDWLRSLRVSMEGEAGGAPRIVLATLPGERHGLGLQMAALLAAVHRIPCRVLGLETPVEEISRAAEEVGTEMVALSVSLASGGVETDRAVLALRTALPKRVRLVVGGAGAHGIRRGPRGVEYVDDLPAWDHILRKMRPPKKLERPERVDEARQEATPRET